MKTVFEKVKFHVDEKKRTVSCVITAKFVAVSCLGDYDILTRWSKYSGINKSFTAVGVSKCHPNDSFDEVTGRRIAESRAKKKIYELGKQEAEKLKGKLKIFSEEVDKSIEFSKLLKIKEEEHIKSLLKD